MPDLKYFFSYTRTDADFVLKVAKQLKAARVDVWVDRLDIVGGQLWDSAVEEALKTCRGMIVVLSPESLASNNVMDEVAYALEEEKLVVPILLRNSTIPFRLRRVQYVDSNSTSVDSPKPSAGSSPHRTLDGIVVKARVTCEPQSVDGQWCGKARQLDRKTPPEFR